VAGSDSLGGDVLEHQRHDGGGDLEAVERPDLRDMATHRRDLHRITQVRPTDDLQAVVGSAVVGAA
jgi:hypothetical protein